MYKPFQISLSIDMQIRHNKLLLSAHKQTRSQMGRYRGNFYFFTPPVREYARNILLDKAMQIAIRDSIFLKVCIAAC